MEEMRVSLRDEAQDDNKVNSARSLILIGCFGYNKILLLQHLAHFIPFCGLPILLNFVYVLVKPLDIEGFGKT